MLQDGLYHVQFIAGAGSGYGTVVVERDRVHGGDTTYFYIGALERSGSKVQLRVRVGRHPNAYSGVSVFGPLDDGVLLLSGSATESSFSLNGALEGSSEARIQIKGSRSSSLDQLSAN